MSDIPATRDVFNIALRSSFRFFLEQTYDTLGDAEPLTWNWHLDAMCYALERVRRGRDKRLVINIPPRHLKTIAVSVAFVAWIMGLDPRQRFICVSHTHDLSLRISRLFRQIVESEWYRLAFPEFQIDRATDSEISTTAGGYRNCTSPSGSVTGNGATYVICDDISKGQDANSPQALENVREFYRHSLITRFNKPATARIIIIGQRIHEDDLPGYCLETGSYCHLNLPAVAQRDEEIPIGPRQYHSWKIGDLLFPTINPQWRLDELIRDMGRRHFNAQILQDPTSAGGDFFTWSNVKRYLEKPNPGNLMKVVQSWDTAEADTAHSDYSTCTTWGYLRGKWLLLDVLRFKAVFRALVERARTHRDHWRADLVLIEEAGSGRHLLGEFKHELRTAAERELWGWKIHGCRPTASKIDRWAAQASKLESGFALLPESAPWMEDFRFELTGFPLRKHDDQVDSVSQFLDWTSWGRSAVTLEREKNRGPDERARRYMNPADLAEVQDDAAYWLNRMC